MAISEERVRTTIRLLDPDDGRCSRAHTCATAELAQALSQGISENAVKIHVSNITMKLQLADRTVPAWRGGLVGG